MSNKCEITEYEIIKGCAEYLQISKADMASDDYMRNHPNVMDILINVAIACREKPIKKKEVTHRREVALSLKFRDIGFSTINSAEERTRDKIHSDAAFERLISKIVEFIIENEYDTII